MPAVWTGGLIPVAVFALDGFTGALGANPVQRLTLQTGLLTLALLLLSLACTPLRHLTGWTWPARIRRALGLLAFGYGALHFAVYLLDHGLNLGQILEDVLKRPFVTAGFAALLLLWPLALTSTPRSVKRLGFARWTRLHRLVYAAAALGVLHYFWGVKKDHTAPLVYGAALLVSLLSRWVLTRRGKSAAR